MVKTLDEIFHHKKVQAREGNWAVFADNHGKAPVILVMDSCIYVQNGIWFRFTEDQDGTIRQYSNSGLAICCLVDSWEEAEALIQKKWGIDR